MPQFLRPSSDRTIAGAWVNEAGGTANLFLSVDEAVKNSADYIQTANNPSSIDLYEGGLSLGALPIAGSHIVRYAIGKNASAGRAIEFIVRLFNNDNTEIASWVHSNIDLEVNYAQTLTGAQVALINSYSGLYYRVNPTTTGGGAGRAGRLYFFEFQIPDPTPSTSVTTTTTRLNTVLTQSPSTVSTTRGVTTNAGRLNTTLAQQPTTVSTTKSVEISTVRVNTTLAQQPVSVSTSTVVNTTANVGRLNTTLAQQPTTVSTTRSVVVPTFTLNSALTQQSATVSTTGAVTKTVSRLNTTLTQSSATVETSSVVNITVTTNRLDTTLTQSNPTVSAVSNATVTTNRLNTTLTQSSATVETSSVVNITVTTNRLDTTLTQSTPTVSTVRNATVTINRLNTTLTQSSATVETSSTRLISVGRLSLVVDQRPVSVSTGVRVEIPHTTLLTTILTPSVLTTRNVLVNQSVLGLGISISPTIIIVGEQQQLKIGGGLLIRKAFVSQSRLELVFTKGIDMSLVNRVTIKYRNPSGGLGDLENTNVNSLSGSVIWDSTISTVFNQTGNWILWARFIYSDGRLRYSTPFTLKMT